MGRSDRDLVYTPSHPPAATASTATQTLRCPAYANATAMLYVEQTCENQKGESHCHPVCFDVRQPLKSVCIIHGTG